MTTTAPPPIYRLTLAQAEIIQKALDGRVKALSGDLESATVYVDSQPAKGAKKTAVLKLLPYFTVVPAPGAALPFRLVPSEYAVASLEGFLRRARQTTRKQFERATKPTQW